MTSSTIVMFIFSLLVCTNAYADIVRSQLTSAIVAREPTTDLNDLVIGQPGKITTVYYFNQLTDMAGTSITHKWLLNGEEKAIVELHIGSNNWRTYSSKRMNGMLQGEWEVQVWHNAKQLQAHRFNFSITH